MAQDIRKITNAAELQQMLDEVCVAVSHLEAKLEFPPNDDLDWERRTRSALAFGRNALKSIRNQMKTLKGEKNKEKSLSVEGDIAKSQAQKALAMAERLKLDSERAAANAERAKANRQIQEAQINAKLLKSISWHVCFVRAARSMLPADFLSKIENAADESYLERLHQQATPAIRRED